MNPDPASLADQILVHDTAMTPGPWFVDHFESPGLEGYYIGGNGTPGGYENTAICYSESPAPRSSPTTTCRRCWTT